MPYKSVKARKHQQNLVRAYRSKYGKALTKKQRDKTRKKWSEKQIIKIAKQEGIDSQKMMVRYHQRLTANLNPNEGIYNNAVYAIQPSGMDNLLPNFPNLTQGQRQIYIDTISVYIVYQENDVGLNSMNHEYIRNFVAYKDDETDATQADITDMFESTGGGVITVMEESMNAVIPQSGHAYKRMDTGWIKYDALRKDSISTGVTVTDVPNFIYPYKRFRKSLRLKKTFQIADNGTLIDWKIPTVAMFFTGGVNEAPDVHCYYHMYYKVLA